MLAYNIIRREASQAAVVFSHSPGDIRFKPVAQYIAVQLIVMAAANPISATGRRLSALMAGIGGLFLDHRPRPSRPRAVKISKTRYPQWIGRLLRLSEQHYGIADLYYFFTV